MLKSSLSDYSDAYILAEGNIAVNNTLAADSDANNTNKKVIFKCCAPFTNFISEIINTQVDNAKDIDVVMPVYNSIEYSDDYSKTFARLQQYCKDTPAVNDNGNIIEFNGANATDSYNFKAKIKGQTDENGRINNVEIMVPLNYFWRTFEMCLINCEVNLILTWSTNSFIIYTDVTNQNFTPEITETKLYVLEVA